METNATLQKSENSEKERRRGKMVELELEEPINFRTHSLAGYEEVKEGKGEMLTFNEEGILLLTDNPLKEGSFINISIKFKELGLLEGVLGKVKKVEESEEHDFYVGIELYSEEKIKAEALSGFFPEKTGSFGVKLKKSLLEYFNKAKESKGLKSLTE
jgi:hypothetical protein